MGEEDEGDCRAGGDWGLPASLMIEGLVRLCRNAVLLSKNTDALTVVALTLSIATRTPLMYQLRVKQLSGFGQHSTYSQLSFCLSKSILRKT